MNRFLVLSSLALGLIAAAVPARADLFGDYLQHHFAEEREAAPPKLDPKRIINDSNAFLKEREPEMTAEEYALYEKVGTMLATNSELAVKLLEGMVTEKNQPSPAFELILGNAYYAAGLNDKAEANFRSAVKRYPSFLRAWNNLGVLCYASGRFNEAVDCFSKCVSLGDRDPATFGLLGYSLERLDNLVSAEMAYIQALSSDPANSDWKEGLLRIYVQGRQYGRAEYLARTLIREKPAEHRFWFGYANILLAENRKLEATAVLEAAASAGVLSADELGLLGDLYADQNLIREAVATYTKLQGVAAIQGEQKLLRVGRVLVSAGRYDEAEKLVADFKGEFTPAGRIGTMQLKADIAIARKQWPAARKTLNELLAIAPLNGPALLALGRVYSSEEDLAHAAITLESAAQVPESTYEAHLELAAIEVKSRRYDKAVEHLQKALAIEKTDAVREYLARIKALAATPS